MTRARVVGWLRACRALGVVALLVALVATPRVALARSLEVGAVDIAATVQSDGSVAVVEQRTYNATGSYSGVYWDVPQGSYEGREVRATVVWVSAIGGGEQVLLEEATTEAPGTYQLTDNGDHLRLKVFWPMEDETVTLQVSYELSNLASRWADVGELYWQYVKADPGSEGEWLNVSCAVRLPVPDGVAVTPGENVRAWGHGPIDGEVSFANDEVRYFSPGVGSNEFLEARVTFPAEWLGDAAASDEARLEGILAEEDQWAKEANAKRRNARLIVYGIPGSMATLGVGSLVAMQWYKAHQRRKQPKAQFSDTYYRDVPTNDHPAVLGMLYREGKLQGKDFSATLMRLTDQRRISLDDVWHAAKTKRGGTKQRHEWRLLLFDQVAGRSDTRAGGKKIDDKAFDFLHDVIADKHKHVIDQSLLGPSGEPYVLMSFFGEVAETWPEAYSQGYNAWSDAVRAAYDKRGFVSHDTSDSLMPGVLGLADFALAVVLAIVGMVLGVPNLWGCLAFVVLFGAGVAIIMLDNDAPLVIFSQEAVEIKAQLEAPRRWLIDFTRLEEAVPTDVVLWNRLLVMATELDVADQVVAQLKVAAPQVLANSAFGAWCGGAVGDLNDPAEAFERSVQRGLGTTSDKLYHEVSTYDTASSSDSSSSGSGGGFSLGGGGGFSGGGGRGGGF